MDEGRDLFLRRRLVRRAAAAVVVVAGAIGVGVVVGAVPGCGQFGGR